MELGATEWAQGDLLKSGVAAAVDGVDVVVHAATKPGLRMSATDVDGTARLIRAMGRSGVRRLVYPSIVGVDRHPLPYYKSKFKAEQLIEGSGLEWTIARATQFHSLLDGMLGSMTVSPLLLLPRGFRFQPLDAVEYTAYLLGLIESESVGRAADMGGPEVLPLSDLVRTYRSARRRRRLVLPLPLFGGVADGFRNGANLTAAGAKLGSGTWGTYLERKYPR